MKSTSPSACWTCKIRKKRCDRTLPSCSACHSLEITCHSGPDRPAWMRSSTSRKEFGDQIKAQIKQKAEARRQSHYVKVLTIREDEIADAPPDLAVLSVSSSSPSSTLVQSSDFSDRSLEETQPSDECSPVQDLSNVDFLLDFEEMTFLDHVFPFLFPFYRPTIFEGGRGWLLGTLKSCKSLYHTAMSFTSYFFALKLGSADDPLYQTCRRQAWEKLATHTDMAIKAMQQAVGDSRTTSATGSVYLKARVMESIVQLLVFETSMGRATDWDIHVAAAISLLKEMIDMQDMKDEDTVLRPVLQTMVKPEWSLITTNYNVWSTDQGAFRFFAAVLIYIDVISSTALQRHPRLHQNLPSLMDYGDNPGQSHWRLKMEGFVGCPGWVLGAVADVTGLRSSLKQGQILQPELQQRGERISETLQRGIVDLEINSDPTIDFTDARYLQYNPDAVRQSAERILSSKIWAHAAHLYLLVTTSGWEVEHPEVREHVAATLDLLQQVSSSGVLRSLAWPFCVAGCLATTDQESSFRVLALVMCSLKAFGAIGESLDIMERVWQMRGQVDSDSWDFGNCFNILGTPALLI